MFIKIPDYISLAINMLNNAGHNAYIVGGCVRDAILNKIPNDWDICTSATPDEICKVFQNYKLLLNGIKHGTVRVIIDHLPIEITTFRIDGNYKDNRRPESVSFSSSLNDDLIRRDFTINAMAYSEKNGIIDLHGGQNDLHAKIIKCVGDASKRFEEDALRIMRALRFSAQLDFKIEPETKRAILSKKDLLKNISAERITEEFFKLISYQTCFDILNEYSDVIKIFLPTFSDVPKKASATTDIRINLAYILSFSDCDYDNIFGNLKIPNALKKDVLIILKNRNLSIEPNSVNIKNHISTFGEELLKLILKYKHFLGENTNVQTEIINKIVSDNEPYMIKHLDISGTDIKNIGCSDSEVGNILKHLLKLVITEKVANNNAALCKQAKQYIKEKDLYKRT